jgi:hypothetical protein
MSLEIENPPAFPHGDGPFGGWHAGMTLRDWFAGQAVVAVMADNTKLMLDGPKPEPKSPENIAAACYVIADAMLAERAKGGAQ